MVEGTEEIGRIEDEDKHIEGLIKSIEEKLTLDDNEHIVSSFLRVVQLRENQNLILHTYPSISIHK